MLFELIELDLVVLVQMRDLIFVGCGQLLCACQMLGFQTLDLIAVVSLHLRNFFLEIFDHIARVSRELLNLFLQIFNLTAQTINLILEFLFTILSVLL